MTAIRLRSRWLVVGGILATALTLVFTPGARSTQPPSPPEVAKADALAAAPGLDRAHSPVYAGAAQERAAADRAAGHVPLPEGGNVFGIRWEEAGDGFSVAEVETVVEANAFCQWLRAADDGRDSTAALRVLDDVPAWPGFRDQPDLPLIREIVAEARAGGGPEYTGAVTDCSRSHSREVSYSQSRGQTPSM